MPLEEIKQLAVPAGDDAILLLWAVNSLLPQALQVIDAWGFSYVTNLVWVKQSIGSASGPETGTNCSCSRDAENSHPRTRSSGPTA